MLTRSDSLALLKVLIAAAWADSRLSQAEINYTKNLAKKFQLAETDWLELEPYLEDPPGEKEIEGLFGDLLSRIGTPAARNEVFHHIQQILNADEQMTAEEHDFLEEYAAIIKDTSTVDLLKRRIRGLFGKRKTSAGMDLDEFIRNKILFKMRRRLGTEQITPETHRLCLLGGLMGVVANADGEIDQRELEEIRRQLRFRGRFDPEALELLISIIEEESVRGLDRARLITEYTGNSSFDERVELLDLLFAVAAVNGSLTHLELEELRGISSAMHLSHRQYIDAKIRSRKMGT
jgi:uncharacterized tellurite resistance protein B-like protein